MFRGWQGDENEKSSAQSFIRFWVSIQGLKSMLVGEAPTFWSYQGTMGVFSIEGNLLEFDAYNSCVNLCCRAYHP